MSTTATQNLIHHHLNQLRPAQWSDLFRYADEALRRLDAGPLELTGEELTYRVLAAVLKAASSGDAGPDAPPGNFASTTAFLSWLRHCIHRHRSSSMDSGRSARELRRECAGQPEMLTVLHAWKRH